MTIRNVAATRVYLTPPTPQSPIPQFHTNHIVELTDHILTRHQPLTTELPHTEWLGGTIIIRNRQAYHTTQILHPHEAYSTTLPLTLL